MAETKNLLSEEIECQFHDLNAMETGSEEKARAVADLEKLYKLHIEETKVELDHQEKVDQRIMSAEQELAKMSEDNKRWKIGTGITILGGIGTLIWKHRWLVESFKFEERGILASPTFKQFILPFIKFKR